MKLIDVFNDRYEHIGTEDKKIAHAKGLWHRTFSALAINSTTQRVVLQKKAPGRYTFDRPDYADITVGGHYQAGETIPEGVREVHEELGLHITYGDLYPIGLRQTAVTLAPDYIEREFQHWHLIPLDVALEEIPLADAEVSGLVEIALDDAITLADGATDAVPARYATRTDNGLEYSEATLTTADLIPNYLKLDQLYLRLFVAARRFCAGERTHVFW
ncbi:MULTISPECIES: NUDIX hydrolase [Actinoalloteichus]|uniref:NUDIX family protein n=1 Tax=Actinoalloteichus fjordicus TaxID=1612552 RepID=A0AAC9L9Y3_9PSEU|nr:MULTISPECIES: NUDIX domain-containing protein [Actinoalloteichus]APU12509.1 NUDIX family protein [Actinoalloteichus fjordicus]APU18463.1 NUDIX family protein [Actinoalloteichus sp. GBA129-24]